MKKIFIAIIALITAISGSVSLSLQTKKGIIYGGRISS